jgi:hypothetical protein
MPASIVNEFLSHSLTSISSCLPPLIVYKWVCDTNLNIDLLIICITLPFLSVLEDYLIFCRMRIFIAAVFGGKCISDESKLEERNQEIPTIKCTRCNRDLVEEASAPLANVITTFA